MTGGGAPGAAGIIRCLKENESFHITLADANPDAVGRFLCDDFETIPVASATSFITAILEVCRKKEIKIILPLVTKELSSFSKHINDFEAKGIKVLVSPSHSLEIANNKSRLYEFLEWRGIPVPAFRVVESVDQFKTAVEELGYPLKPVCFKPSVSNGSRGFRIVSEQMNELDLLFNHKPTSTYLSLRDAIRILSSGSFPELLISEYLPGEEFSVDCIAKDGDPVLIVPRLRKKMINGISVEGEFIKDDVIISYCKQIIKALSLHGNIGIQVKKSATGHFLILEINPRVQGTISAALGAGVNLPELAVKQELNLPISSKEMDVKWNTKFSRYWNEVFY